MGLVLGIMVRQKIRIKNVVIREFLAEFLGMFTLMCLGLGANSMFVLSPSLNTFLSVNVAWGLSVAVAVWMCANVTGGQINPAVTLAMAVLGRMSWRKVLVYWLAQYTAAFMASACIYCVYFDALNHFDGGQRSVIGANATAGIFATYPQPYLSIGGGLIDQIFGTMLLLMCIMGLTDVNNMAPPRGVAPLCVGMVVLTIGATFGMNCGYAINPARDLSPRIFTAVAGWGAQVFTAYNYWFWVPIIGPHIGAILGAWLYIGLVGAHLADVNRHAASELNDVIINVDGPSKPSSLPSLLNEQIFNNA